MRTIVIDPVTRIEGHAKITIQSRRRRQGRRARRSTSPQIRGFEKFTEGRPFYEMPAITARICGICPISHLLASVEGLRRHHERAHPADRGEAAGASALRPDRAVACAELLPPLLARSAARLRFRSGAAQRHRRDRGPSGARQGRHRAAQVRSAGDREPGQGAHPSVLDGARRRQRAARSRQCATASSPACRRRRRSPCARWISSRASSTSSATRSPISATPRPCTPGWSTTSGGLQLYDGGLRFVDAEGKIVADQMRAADYQQYIGEASVPYSYLKAPYFKPLGFPDGVYRVGPLARLNVADALRHAAGRRRIRRVPPALRQGRRRARSTSITRA